METIYRKFYSNYDGKKKIYAITHTVFIDDFSKEGYTTEIYDAFFSTRELAEKANKEKFFGRRKIKEITLDVVEVHCFDFDDDDEDDDEDDDKDDGE